MKARKSLDPSQAAVRSDNSFYSICLFGSQLACWYKPLIAISVVTSGSSGSAVMKRGVTPTVSLLLVGVCLAMSGGAVTSVTGDKSGRSYGRFSLCIASVFVRLFAADRSTQPAGASGRRMLQETDQSPTKSDSTEDSHDATLQRAPENSTDISNESPIAAADKSPDVSGSDTIKADESDAAATASEPDTTTLSSDADGKAGETSAGSEEDDIVNSGQAAASSGADQPDSHDSDGIVADDKQAADLTFDEALAQTALGAELSDPTPSSNTSSSNQSTSDDLTFDQAVAATNGTQSITEVIANSTQSSASELKALDPRAASPVRESLLPYVESANGSLSAAIQESDDASNATAASSRDGSTLNVTHWTGLANATVTKVGEELTKTATASTSLLDEVRIHASCYGSLNVTVVLAKPCQLRILFACISLRLSI